MERLKRRMDFRSAASGARAPVRAFVLQARRRADAGEPRVGFTVSRQVGNAVERNRVRRRLRDMVRLTGDTASEGLNVGYDYVLIGRRAALQARFADMTGDLQTALRRVHSSGRAATGGPDKRPLHEAGPSGRTVQRLARRRKTRPATSIE